MDNMNNMDNMDNKWIYMPKNIKGINYSLIDKIAKQYENIIPILAQLKNKIMTESIMTESIMTESKVINNDNDDDNDILLSTDNIRRLEPPFNNRCVFYDDSCIKKAAFKHIITNKYYCWFHISCSK